MESVASYNETFEKALTELEETVLDVLLVHQFDPDFTKFMVLMVLFEFLKSYEHEECHRFILETALDVVRG